MKLILLLIWILFLFIIWNWTNPKLRFISECYRPLAVVIQSAPPLGLNPFHQQKAHLYEGLKPATATYIVLTKSLKDGRGGGVEGTAQHDYQDPEPSIHSSIQLSTYIPRNSSTLGKSHQVQWTSPASSVTRISPHCTKLQYTKECITKCSLIDVCSVRHLSLRMVTGREPNWDNLILHFT